MSQDLKLQVLLNAVDRVSGPLRKILGGTSATAKALKEAKDRLRDLNRTQEQVQGFRKISAQASESAVALKAAQQKAAQLRAGMAGLENPTKKATLALDRAERSVGKLRRAHLDNLRALKDSKAGLDRSGLAVNKLAEHERRLRAETDRTTDQIARQSRELDKLTSRTNKLQMARRKLDQARGLAGASASAGASLGVAAGVTAAPVAASIAAFASQEEAASQLRAALMGADGKVSAEFERIDALAQRLGNRLPGTTADFYEMMTMLRRQGMSAKVILGGLGEATAYLGVQLRMPYTEAAEFAAKLQDATRATEAEMMGLADTIQRTFYLGVDSQNMLQGFSKLSPALATLRMKGLQATDALAPLLVMADQAGMAGEAAGNAYRKVFQYALDQKKLGKANALLADLGMKLDFSNGRGEFGGIDQLFAQLAQLKKLTTQDRLAVLKKLFGDDAETLQVVSLLIDKGQQGYGEVQAKMAAQADLQRRVNGQLGTLRNLWEAATGTFTNALASWAGSVQPEIKALTQWLADLAGRIQSWVQENPKLAAGLFKATAALAGLLAVASAIALAFASVLTPLALLRWSVATLGLRLGGLMTPISWLFRTALPMLGKVLLWVGRLMLTNPILLILTAVAGAAYLIWKNWSTIGPAIAGMWDSITVYAQNAWNGVLGFIGGLWTRFKGVGAQLMQGLIAGLLGGLKAVGDTIRGIGDQVVGWFKTKLGIRSPSRVFAMLGDYTMQGLAGGLDRSRSLPIQAMQRATGGLRAAGAGLALAAATPAVAIDQRGPIARPPMQASAGDTYHITIQAAGSAAQDIAAAVRAELERIEREKAARKRSTLSDYT